MSSIGSDCWRYNNKVQTCLSGLSPRLCIRRKKFRSGSGPMASPSCAGRDRYIEGGLPNLVKMLALN